MLSAMRIGATFNEELREIRRPERIGWKVLDKLKVRGEEVKAFALASTAITPP